MKLHELARTLRVRALGGDVEITGIASLGSAGPHDLVFVEDAKYLPAALASAAGALVAGEFAEGAEEKPRLIVRQPKLAFARAARLVRPEPRAGTGMHPSAVVHPTAQVGRGVSIGPHVVIEADARIAEGSSLGAGTFIGAGVVMGRECDLRSNVSIYAGTRLGDRVIVHAGAVLGSDGFGFVHDAETGRYEKFPQVGRLEIGDDVEIGANSTVDRGALDATVIGRGTKLDNLVHIAHNAQIGEDIVIAAQTGISGSAVLEDSVVVAGQVGIADHVRVETGVILGAQCGVPTGKVIRGKGILFWGTPARPIRQYLKELAVLARLAKK
jgi:UDP-3-O-[3-hydroxymyristoyl] glucosamine N-acyltransferase